MKRFEAKLGGLQRVQKVDVDRRRAELHRRVANALSVEKELRTLAAERGQKQAQLRSLRDGVLDMNDLLSQQRYLNSLQRREREKATELVARRREVAAMQRDVAAARQRQKAVDRLEERRREQHEESMVRLQQHELDEVSQALRAAREAVPASDGGCDDVQ